MFIHNSSFFDPANAHFTIVERARGEILSTLVLLTPIGAVTNARMLIESGHHRQRFTIVHFDQRKVVVHTSRQNCALISWIWSQPPNATAQINVRQ
jgi:hypothetical protein